MHPSLKLIEWELACDVQFLKNTCFASNPYSLLGFEMKRLIACIVVVLMCSGCGGETGNGTESPAGFSLESYTNKNAVVIVFGDNRADFMAQLDAEKAEMEEHGVVVIEVWDLAAKPQQGKIRDGAALTESEAGELVEKFNPDSLGLTVVLIGENGETSPDTDRRPQRWRDYRRVSSLDDN